MTNVHVITQDSPVIQADSERMKGLLKQATFEITENLEEGDIVIFNTCSARTSSETDFFTELEELKKEYPYKIFIVAGCLALSNSSRLKPFSAVGPEQFHRIVEAVEESLNDNVVKMLKSEETPPLMLPTLRGSSIVEIIPVNRGCLPSCTYCKPKPDRNMKSYPLEDIVATARKALQEGVKEIWLTSWDTLCYGFDTGTNIAKLLQELVNLPGAFKIRLDMGNPAHLLKMKDQLFPLLGHEKMFKFLHLPAQSGSNKLLKAMHKEHTKEDFLELVSELKIAVPNITLATDFVVGFPSETDDDHWQTLELVRKTMPDLISIWQYRLRDSPSAEPGQEEIIKRRASVLTDIFHNISKLQNERWRGWEGEILIEQKGREEQQWIGRNEYYKPVIVEGNFTLGAMVKVRIMKTDTSGLKGEVVEIKQ